MYNRNSTKINLPIRLESRLPGARASNIKRPSFRTFVTMFMIVSQLFFVVAGVQCLCGESVRWLHNFNVMDVYGMWYGVGYAQHTPDMTNKPNEIGCVTINISDATYDYSEYWTTWPVRHLNYTSQQLKSSRSNPWSHIQLPRSTIDGSTMKKVKRRILDEINERKLKIIWDEDGQSMEQVYIYSPDDPGIWTAEVRRPGEQEMLYRRIDIWYPDVPPKHPEVIRVLKVTPSMLIINHCSEIGVGGLFSLIFSRSDTRYSGRQEWYQIKKQFYNFELPELHRFTAICSSCVCKSSLIYIGLSLLVISIIINYY